MGNFTFKALDDLNKEPEENKNDLTRIISTFRQKEMALIDAFNYFVIHDTQDKINTLLVEFKRSLEIYRYLSVDTNNKGLDLEHTTAYLIYPDARNPWVLQEKEKHYMYRMHENVTGNERYASFPHANRRPLFYKDVYGESPPFIDEKLHQKLENSLSERDLRAITWYNKTYSTTAKDDRENLLHLSVAFESHFSLDEKVGKKEALSQVSEILSMHIKEPVLSLVLKEISHLTASLIVKQLADAVNEVTGSVSITKWFKRHLYSVGSGIRHGAEVSELPKPVISKRKLGKSLYYAGDASHEYLNNVYFGKRLFKFLFEETYFPYTEHIKKLNIDLLEQLLISDEERLKKLEKALSSKKIGKLTQEDVNIAYSFTHTFYGSKVRILNILKRLLEEVKIKPEIWDEISTHGELILSTNFKEIDFMDYEKTKSFSHALIEIGSVFDSKRTSTTLDEEEIKHFYVRQFVSYSLHKLI